MAARTNLMGLDMILDDSTGIYKIGEIDFGMKTALLKKQFQERGEECFKEVIMALSFLTKKTYDVWSDSRPEANTGECQDDA